MRPLSEMTDNCLRLMNPHRLWSWEYWWTKIVKNGEVPSRKTFAYEKFIQKRAKIKNDINKELQRQQKPERLLCPGVGQGIYLVNEKDVAELTVDKRVRRIVNCFIKSQKDMVQLAVCERISGDDKRMLSHLSGLIELQQNTMIGTMAKMRSLPPATKKRLLKRLGIDAK